MPWQHGNRIANYMRLVRIRKRQKPTAQFFCGDINNSINIVFLFQKTEHGITGQIVFNDEGQRTHFYLEITELSKDGFKRIGIWDPVTGVNYTRSSGEAYTQIIESLQEKNFLVASRLGAPFLMLR